MSKENTLTEAAILGNAALVESILSAQPGEPMTVAEFGEWLDSQA